MTAASPVGFAFCAGEPSAPASFIFLPFYMANTYSNSVIIGAPRHQVADYFIDMSIGDYRFNMAKLFPEQFHETDKTGDDTWNSAWCCDHTGSPTLPDIYMTDR